MIGEMIRLLLNAKGIRTVDRTKIGATPVGRRAPDAGGGELAGGETAATIGAAAAHTNGTNTAMVYGTDGGIVAANLQILEDDRHDQPVYAPVPIIREAVLKANPQIARIVKPVMESLSRETLQQLNPRVQIYGGSVG